MAPWIITKLRLGRGGAFAKRNMERITNVQSFGNVDCWNVKSIYNKAISVNRTDNEDNQIKQWLSPLETQHRHQSVQADRVNGVGSWLLERDEFREWSGSEGMPERPVLFCYGDPGVGKTHIRSVRMLSQISGYY